MKKSQLKIDRDVSKQFTKENNIKEISIMIFYCC